jgi:hypothetical protein
MPCQPSWPGVVHTWTKWPASVLRHTCLIARYRPRLEPTAEMRPMACKITLVVPALIEKAEISDGTVILLAAGMVTAAYLRSATQRGRTGGGCAHAASSRQASDQPLPGTAALVTVMPCAKRTMHCGLSLKHDRDSAREADGLPATGAGLRCGSVLLPLAGLPAASRGRLRRGGAGARRRDHEGVTVRRSHLPARGHGADLEAGRLGAGIGHELHLRHLPGRAGTFRRAGRRRTAHQNQTVKELTPCTLERRKRQELPSF